MTHTRVYRSGKLESQDFDPHLLSDFLEEPDTVVWLDLQEPRAADLRLIAEEFGLHPLAVEDSVSVDHSQRPKLETYENHSFLVAHALSLNAEVVVSEVDMFVGERFFVTVRKGPAWPIDAVLRRWDGLERASAPSVSALLYELLDQLVDGYFHVVEGLEDRVEALEDRLFDADRRTSVQQEIFELRKQLLAARRSMYPLRDVLNALLRRDSVLIDPAMHPYFTDVYDHVIRLTENIEVMRELLSSSLEVHLSVVSNKLNDIMKKVTSWAAILGVATTIAGIYGMNFELVPEEQSLFGFWFAVGLIAISCLALYVYFKARDWL